MTKVLPAPFLTDTHAHLASSRFVGKVDEVIANAKEQGVGRIISISCDEEDSVANLALSEAHPNVFPTVGIHPLYIHEIAEVGWLEGMRILASNPSVSAIGEIGLDYFHPPGDGGEVSAWRRKQRVVFEALLQLAIDLDLPAVIHQRESSSDVMATLRNFPGVRAVLHCFSGTAEDAAQAIESGHFLSFTGVVTFSNADQVRAAAAITPLDRLMVETDAPYLAPVPFRGKTCEPAMLPHTARVIGSLHGLSLEEIASVTSGNADRFFRLLKPEA